MGARSDLPVFIVGMPRSGTTLAEQILASHPMVHGAGELRRLQALGDGIEGFPAGVAACRPQQLKAMGEAYLAHVGANGRGRTNVVDKMPSNFAACRHDPTHPAGRSHHSLPAGSRSDICLSCYTKLFAGEQAFTYDQTELGRFHRAYQGLMAHWRSALPASHFLEVDYEAVVEDIEGQARRMLDFLACPGTRRPEVPRDRSPGADRKLEPGAPADLSFLVRALAQTRGRAEATARCAERR